MSDLFDHPAERPYEATEDVAGPTAAALLGDATPSPARAEPEQPDALEAAGVPVRGYEPPDRCPSCGVALPDPSHPVDASLRH